jgi:DNA primase
MAQPDLLGRLTPLLEPSDVQRLSLANPQLQLRGATAALERQRSLKRCRHLLNAWGTQRLETLERCIARLLEEDSATTPAGLDMETRIDAMFAELNSDALRFQELYYNERQHISHLDDQRRAGYEDVLRQRQDVGDSAPLDSLPA